MEKLEKIGTDPSEANRQLQGFEIADDHDKMTMMYDGLFDGIESRSLDELFEEFRGILDGAPEDVKTDLLHGETQRVEQQAREWGWSSKKIKQLVIFALVAFSALDATQALAAGKEDQLHNMQTVKSRIAQLQMPSRVRVLGEGMTLAPVDRERNAMMMQDKSHDHGMSHGRFTINGQPAKVMYNDGHRVVFGGEGSIYRNDANGQVAVGVVVVE